jgi:hypothetical protein
MAGGGGALPGGGRPADRALRPSEERARLSTRALRRTSLRQSGAGQGRHQKALRWGFKQAIAARARTSSQRRRPARTVRILKTCRLAHVSNRAS